MTPIDNGLLNYNPFVPKEQILKYYGGCVQYNGERYDILLYIYRRSQQIYKEISSI